MKQLNVLYISYDGATDPLGQSQVIPYLKKLALYNVKYFLVTYDKIFNRNKVEFSSLSNELEAMGIHWISLKYHKNPRIIAKIYDICFGVFICSTLIIKHKIKIVHGRSFVGAFIGMVLKKVFRVKFLLDYRGLWADERVDGNLWPRGGLLYKLSKFIEKLLLLSAQEIVVLTNKAKDIISSFSYLRDRKLAIEVIPTCVDLDRFQYRNDGFALKQMNKINLVYLGSLGTWYMLDEMIDFFVELCNDFTCSHFSLITPTSEKIIEEAMQRKGVLGSSYSVNNVSYDKVPEMISAADLSIIFIKPLFSKMSSCPTKFGESLACGIPVIINYGIGDCDEIVQSNKVGVLVKDFNTQAYRSAIDALKNIVNNRKEFSNNCRLAAESLFSLEKGVEAYYKIYKRLNIKEGAS